MPIQSTSVGVQHPDALSIAHGQAGQVPSLGGQALQQRAELCAEILPLGEGLPGAIDGFRQALLAEGLEQVVEGVDFKGTDGVLVVGGDKDDRWRVFQRLDDAKTIQSRHLNVQQYQLGRPGFDHLHGLHAVLGFADDFYPFEVGQVPLEPLPRRGLIVYDQGSHGHWLTSLVASHLLWPSVRSPGRQCQRQPARRD